MSLLHIQAELDYQVNSDSSFYFSVLAARTDHQIVEQESLTINPPHRVEYIPYGIGGHQLVRLTASPGPLELRYGATVRLDPQRDDPHALQELSFNQLPAEVLCYLNPSRYCESDKLSSFVQRELGDVAPGYARVRAVSDWVNRHMAYVPGTTDASSSAADALLLRAGVCRDFAHVAISLCRAMGIPARYLSGYGIGVEPQDFHGFFEAFLDGDWYLFDPTGMAPSDGLVRIGVGRDAADVPFSTFVGSAALLRKAISVTRDESQASAAAPTTATSTA